MKNPYEILGISPSATNEEVRAAYRTLAKKYHPDNYIDSPVADLAEEKMKDINRFPGCLTCWQSTGRGRAIS